MTLQASFFPDVTDCLHMVVTWTDHRQDVAIESETTVKEHAKCLLIFILSDVKIRLFSNRSRSNPSLWIKIQIQIQIQIQICVF